jgi:dethiobiotin synthetase
MNRKLFIVAGTGTGIGKTIVAAILTEALEADYWKPIQSGNLGHTDTDEVRSLVTNTRSIFHKEAYRLTQPLSPHAAAHHDGIEIDLNKFSLPVTNNTLIIELAGGLMVPLNSKELNIDLLQQWNAPVILVSQNYLGSINHTLLSVEVLKNRNIQLAGIIFNGETNLSSEDYILQYTGINCIAKIQQQEHINKETVRSFAKQLKPSFEKLLS